MTTFPSNQNFVFTETLKNPYPEYPTNVVAVLDSVKKQFSKYFERIDERPLHVLCNHPSKTGPETVHETCTIYLYVAPFAADGTIGNFWSQFIYQFSHELCHYMTFGHVIKSMRWFEETLCELASHFFLLEIADSWEVFPPFPNWKDYSMHLRSYQHDSSQNTEPFNTLALLDPQSEILKSLEKNEYQRELNRYVALKLLPLFIESPSLWRIVPCLSKLGAVENQSFQENLAILSGLSKQDTSKILAALKDL